MAVYRNNGPRPVWSPQKEFRFPTSHHLVITTAAEISLLSKKGVRPLLNSPSDGILAVREAKDGSGNIAFADGRIVIVHSIQRVSGKTFKLHAEKVHKMPNFSLFEYSYQARVRFDCLNFLATIKDYSSLLACIIPFYVFLSATSVSSLLRFHIPPHLLCYFFRKTQASLSRHQKDRWLYMYII